MLRTIQNDLMIEKKKNFISGEDIFIFIIIILRNYQVFYDNNSFKQTMPFIYFQKPHCIICQPKKYINISNINFIKLLPSFIRLSLVCFEIFKIKKIISFLLHFYYFKYYIYNGLIHYRQISMCIENFNSKFAQAQSDLSILFIKN